MNVHLSNSRTKALLETARRYLPGGSFNSNFLNEEHDVVVAKGSGSKVVDVDGREFIDCMLGSGPMLLGHAHPEVVEAIKQAVECPSNYYALNERGIQLAEKLVYGIPCADQVKFGLSGSDATFFAMRLARASTGRAKVLKFEGGFIGVNDYALMSVTPKRHASYPTPLPDSAGIPKQLEREVLVAPFNDLQTTLQIIEDNKDDLAAVIVEAQHRCIEPAPGFLEGLRKVTSALGIVLIFDEVVTGFRLAYGGAQERFGVTPDLATYGKVIGGGMPLSAVAGKKEIMDLANPRKSDRSEYTYISSTMSGHVVAAAAGLAALTILQRPKTYEHLYALGRRFQVGANDIFKRNGIPAQVIGSGPVALVAMTDKPVTDYWSFISGDRNMHRRLFDEMLSRGVLTNGKMYFSTAHTDKDIDRVLEILETSVRSVLKVKAPAGH